MRRNYDCWFAGASEFFFKVGSVEGFSASTEAELKLYNPQITDFMPSGSEIPASTEEPAQEDAVEEELPEGDDGSLFGMLEEEPVNDRQKPVRTLNDASIGTTRNDISMEECWSALKWRFRQVTIRSRTGISTSLIRVSDHLSSRTAAMTTRRG